MTAIRELRRLSIDPGPDADNPLTYVPAGHTGSAPERVDFELHGLIERFLTTRLPGIVVLGEEVDRTLNLVDGDVVALIDPVDGTSPYARLRYGYAVSVLISVMHERRARPALSAIGLPTGHVVIWQAGRVFVGLNEGPDHERASLRTRPIGRAPAIAMVGAKPGDRVAFASLATALTSQRSDAVLFNQAGNPAILGLIAGDLDAMVSLKPTQVWDAVYVLAASACGAYVATLDGVSLSPEHVRAAFEVSPVAAKPIPPFVVAKDSEIMSLVLGAVEVPSSSPPWIA